MAPSQDPLCPWWVVTVTVTVVVAVVVEVNVVVVVMVAMVMVCIIRTAREVASLSTRPENKTSFAYWK